MAGGERKSPRPVNIRRQSFINDTPKRRAAGGKYPLPRHLGFIVKNDWHCKNNKNDWI